MNEQKYEFIKDITKNYNPDNYLREYLGVINKVNFAYHYILTQSFDKELYIYGNGKQLVDVLITLSKFKVPVAGIITTYGDNINSNIISIDDLLISKNPADIDLLLIMEIKYNIFVFNKIKNCGFNRVLFW